MELHVCRRLFPVHACLSGFHGVQEKVRIMQQLITIIIPVHNSLVCTRRCLNGLSHLIKKAASDTWLFKIVVVDDGSVDGTADWICEKHPEVHLLTGCGNLWWSGGINKGMQYAMHALKSDYILWWNNDIYPADDYFDCLVNLLEESDQARVYGSKIYQAENPGLIWSFGGFFHRLWGHGFLLGKGEPDGDKFSKPLDADWLPGMGTLLPKEVIAQTGDVNDKDFPQYHGDIDYTCRARQAGFSLEVQPSLQIWNYTRHSGRSHDQKFRKLFSTLRDIKSLDHFRKEWLLYRKHAITPLVYLVVIKKYVTYFIAFIKNKIFS